MGELLMGNLYTEIRNIPLKINEELVERANNQSQFDAGLCIKNSHIASYEQFFTKFADKLGFTEDQRRYLVRRAGEWKDLIEKSCNEELRRRANFVPVNVAGPAKYNFNKANKQTERDFKSIDDYAQKMDSFIENTVKGLENLTPIETVIAAYRSGKRRDEVDLSDEYALEKLNARLEYLTEYQARAKQMNKWYRKHKTMKGFDNYTDEKAAELDAAIAKGYSWEQVPVPSYELTSLNGKIKRVKARMEHITAMRANKPIKGYKFDGGEVEANYDENRLQVIFDSKPDEQTRQLLKASGFHWSPSFGAWQRQLTENALDSAKKILPQIGGEEDV
jgi:hypothetical protein